MKLIQEIGPFFALKGVFWKKKIHPPHKNPPSTFIDFSKKFQPPRLIQPPLLFQPPRLLILAFLHPLHVYSNLQAY